MGKSTRGASGLRSLVKLRQGQYLSPTDLESIIEKALYEQQPDNAEQLHKARISLMQWLIDFEHFARSLEIRLTHHPVLEGVFPSSELEAALRYIQYLAQRTLPGTICPYCLEAGKLRPRCHCMGKGWMTLGELAMYCLVPAEFKRRNGFRYAEVTRQLRAEGRARKRKGGPRYRFRIKSPRSGSGGSDSAQDVDRVRREDSSAISPGNSQGSTHVARTTGDLSQPNSARSFAPSGNGQAEVGGPSRVDKPREASSPVWYKRRGTRFRPYDSNRGKEMSEKFDFGPAIQAIQDGNETALVEQMALLRGKLREMFSGKILEAVMKFLQDLFAEFTADPDKLYDIIRKLLGGFLDMPPGSTATAATVSTPGTANWDAAALTEKVMASDEHTEAAAVSGVFLGAIIKIIIELLLKRFGTPAPTTPPTAPTS